MKLLITGSSGFLGKHVVAEALRQGHQVRALVRPATSLDGLPWRDHPQVEIARADLRSRSGLEEVVAGVDCVLHLAADKGGDVYAQYGGTVIATEHLLEAMEAAGVRSIVGISSFSIYGYLHKRSFSLLDEETPVESDPRERDAYGHTKLVQENLIRDFAQKHGWRFVILRPGAIFGRDNLWTARLGMQLSDTRWVRTGAWARVPLSYVENCAEAIVMAAACDAADGATLNVLDDNPPTQSQYISALRRKLDHRVQLIRIPWFVMRILARSAWLTNKIVFRGGAKTPSIFVPARLHARCKPLRYSNRRLRETLGWTPRWSLDEALDRSLAPTDPVDGEFARASESAQAQSKAELAA